MHHARWFPGLFSVAGAQSRIVPSPPGEENCVGSLAEQIFIDCPPSRLEDLFCHRPADWITPLLRLAGDEGEAAGLALLGQGAAADRRQSPRRRGHRIEIRRATRVDGIFRVGLHWQTTDYRALFGEFDGTLEVRPLNGHTVLSVEGEFAGTRPPPPSTGMVAMAARRAAESAIRSLLGHVRSAVEKNSFSPH